MAAKDYIANYEDATVTKNGIVLAHFNTVSGEVTDLTEAGKRCGRWIKEAINAVSETAEPLKPSEVHPDDVLEIRTLRKDIYTVFPGCVRPKDNKIGFSHPEIHDWVLANYPAGMKLLYPRGKWTAENAAQKGNLAVTLSRKAMAGGSDGTQLGVTV